jgi:hypothetical protein
MKICYEDLKLIQATKNMVQFQNFFTIAVKIQVL